jgi:hypothetical protein
MKPHKAARTYDIVGQEVNNLDPSICERIRKYESSYQCKRPDQKMCNIAIRPKIHIEKSVCFVPGPYQAITISAFMYIGPINTTC